VPNFRRGRWHAGWLLVSHRGDDVRRARDSSAQMQFASVGGGWTSRLGWVAWLAGRVVGLDVTLNADVACADWTLMWQWRGHHHV
jgi:hypothetical protein